MKRRNRRTSAGQSMVEYALGLGCVAGLCMISLGSLGHICGDMISAVQNAINYGGSKAGDPGRIVNNSATPWIIN